MIWILLFQFNWDFIYSAIIHVSGVSAYHSALFRRIFRNWHCNIWFFMKVKHFSYRATQQITTHICSVDFAGPTTVVAVAGTRGTKLPATSTTRLAMGLSNQLSFLLTWQIGNKAGMPILGQWCSFLHNIVWVGHSIPDFPGGLVLQLQVNKNHYALWIYMS
jgi:hypothetical protein